MTDIIKQEIWIASYLVPSRFDTFKRALKSFNEQTLKAPVFISVSGPAAWRAADWAVEILTDVYYEISLYKERMSQFDQLYKIFIKKQTGSDCRVYISVCDDDDWFEPNRIEVQQQYLDRTPSGWPARESFRCGVLGRNVCRDFGCFCFNLKHLHWFFSEEGMKTLRLFPRVAPDVIFCASMSYNEIKEALHNRVNSLWDRTYNETRENGSK